MVKSRFPCRVLTKPSVDDEDGTVISQRTSAVRGAGDNQLAGDEVLHLIEDVVISYRHECWRSTVCLAMFVWKIGIISLL